MATFIVATFYILYYNYMSINQNSYQEITDEQNNSPIIELLSEPIFFETVIYSFFNKNIPLDKAVPKHFNKEIRIDYLVNNMELIIYNLQKKEKFGKFLIYLDYLSKKKTIKIPEETIMELKKIIESYINKSNSNTIDNSTEAVSSVTQDNIVLALNK